MIGLRARAQAAGTRDVVIEVERAGGTWLGVAAFFPLVILASGPAVTQAHDIYTGLYTKYGTACCDRTDCRPARYRTAGKGSKCWSVTTGFPCRRTRFNTDCLREIPAKRAAAIGVVTGSMSRQKPGTSQYAQFCHRASRGSP